MPDKSTEPTTNKTQPRVGATISPKRGVAYTNIPRELSENDLKQVAVVRMIINERDNLQAENIELKTTRTKLIDSVTQNAILSEKLKTFTAFEIISTGTISIGSIFVGAAIEPFIAKFFILGIVLIIVGIVAKTIKIK